MSGFYFALGLVIVLITAANVIFTLILPRRPAGIERLSLMVNRVVRFIFLVISRAAKSYEVKDALLAPAAPVALLAQLAVWLGFFVVGYACMLEPTTHGFAASFTQAAVALFSVGTAHAGGPPNQTVDIAAGATWAVVVTLQIAYLPSLYDAFNRREALVAMLESRAGLPAWGPEVLARHQLVGIIDALPSLYADWERLAADLAESHTTYPVLLLFRSPEPWYSWVVGLLAVLDAAAMDLALSPDASSSQARLCLRMGFTTFNRIAKTLGWPVDPDPNPEGPINLTFEEFAQAVRMLEEIGYPMELTAEEAWPNFRGWRVNYETNAYRLADRVVSPPAPWSGPRTHLRSGPVAPRRPPQRSPAGKVFAAHRPEAPSSPARRRGSPTRPRQSP
ncbi:MAG TPA: hypothetical protein VMU64_04410 [Acidimicrobiales bacterium]|nr:hypothetical protein [Acidimicrobiales bacterium]